MIGIDAAPPKNFKNVLLVHTIFQTNTTTTAFFLLPLFLIFQYSFLIVKPKSWCSFTSSSSAIHIVSHFFCHVSLQYLHHHWLVQLIFDFLLFIFLLIISLAVLLYRFSIKRRSKISSNIFFLILYVFAPLHTIL